MTGLQAEQVIQIVLHDQRLNVLAEVRRMIAEQCEQIKGVRLQGEDIAADSAIGTLQVLEAKLDALVKRTT